MKLIRKFISYYKPHKKLFIIDMLCSFLVALCDLVYPIIARNITNKYILLPPGTAIRTIVVWAVALLFIYALKAVLSFVVQNWGHVMGARMQGDMRRDMFEHLQKLPISFFDENRTGTIMSRMINDLMDVSELAHHGPENLFLSTIKLAKGRTCLIVAHRLSTVKNADEIIVLDSTGVIERGTHDALLAKNGTYAELYKYQFKEA